MCNKLLKISILFFIVNIKIYAYVDTALEASGLVLQGALVAWDVYKNNKNNNDNISIQVKNETSKDIKLIINNNEIYLRSNDETYIPKSYLKLGVFYHSSNTLAVYKDNLKSHSIKFMLSEHLKIRIINTSFGIKASLNIKKMVKNKNTDSSEFGADDVAQACFEALKSKKFRV